MSEPTSENVFGLSPQRPAKMDAGELEAARIEREVVRRLKDAYGYRFQQRTGRPYKPNSRADNAEAWKRVAKACIRLGAEPEHFMEAQFMYSRSLPLVNTLHADRACKRFTTFRFTKGYAAADQGTPIDSNAMMKSPGHALLKELVDSTVQYLQVNHGDSDLSKPDTAAFVQAAPWQLSPVAVLALNSGEPYMSLYAASAEEELQREPALERALRETPEYAHVATAIHEHLLSRPR